MRIILGTMLALFLAGCAGGPQQLAPTAVSAEAAPVEPVTPLALADAKKRILAERNRLWKDPDSIRDASIGDVHFCAIDEYLTGKKRPGQCVCVTLNAKNSMGGYTGVRRTLFVFWNSGGMETRDGAILGYDEYCASTRPWPEMDAKADRRRR